MMCLLFAVTVQAVYDSGMYVTTLRAAAALHPKTNPQSAARHVHCKDAWADKDARRTSRRVLVLVMLCTGLASGSLTFACVMTAESVQLHFGNVMAVLLQPGLCCKGGRGGAAAGSLVFQLKATAHAPWHLFSHHARLPFDCEAGTSSACSG